MTKPEKFKAGLWVASVPWVSHLWSDFDWIIYINLNGRWFDSKKEMIDLFGPDFE
jgi:hypothetical protein